MNVLTAKKIIFILLCLCAGKLSAQTFIPLWPEGKMPNSKQLQLKDSIANERIYQVGTPGMYAFFPSDAENKGAAVVICPGGGYERLAYVISGTQLAKWFNVMGMTAFVLNYRLPNSPDLPQREIAPLQDAQRAIRVIRANAARWKIDTARIGVQGSSAGGHLAALASVSRNDYSAIGDSLNAISFHPNFSILVSPVIDMGAYTHAGSRKNLLGNNPSPELVTSYSLQYQVNEGTAPAFIVHAFNDKTVSVRNSLLFYQALVEKNVSSSLHIFPAGGHSIALRNNPGSTDQWTTLCESWLKESGFLEKK
jgi:acetyl esterase/lipase